MISRWIFHSEFIDDNEYGIELKFNCADNCCVHDVGIADLIRVAGNVSSALSSNSIRIGTFSFFADWNRINHHE